MSCDLHITWILLATSQPFPKSLFDRFPCVRAFLLYSIQIWLKLSFPLFIQEHYQRSIDGEDMSKIPKEEDPFWEPPEDVRIGTASVFLQSLSYELDFDDKLSITDYKVCT